MVYGRKIRNTAPWIQILRPLNVFLGLLSLFITAQILHLPIYDRVFFTTALVIATLIGASNITNDIFDIRIDMVNRPNRPLPSGKIRLRVAILYTIILYVIGITATFQLNSGAQLLALGFVLPLTILYTPFLKKVPLLGNLVIGLILGSVFIFSELSLTGQIRITWVPAGLAAGLTTIRELVKDMQDIKGDLVREAMTFPVKYGLENSFYMLVFLSVILCGGALYPYFSGTYGYWYYGTLLAGVEIPLLGSLYYLSRNLTRERCGHVAQVMKLSTVAGLIVIWTTGL